MTSKSILKRHAVQRGEEMTQDKLKKMMLESGMFRFNGQSAWQGGIQDFENLARLVSANAITSMQTTIDAMTETAKDASNRAINDHNEITKLKAALEKINTLRSSTLNYGVARAISCEALGIEHTDSKQQPVTSMQGDSEYSLVSNDVLAFLHGEAELDGMGFDDAVEAIKGSKIGKYWWRKYLRDATKPVSQLSTNADGWVSIPKEPTEAMKRALFTNLVHADDEAYVIKAIINAAISQPKGESL